MQDDEVGAGGEVVERDGGVGAVERERVGIGIGEPLAARRRR